MIGLFILLNLVMVFAAWVAASSYTRGYYLAEVLITTFLFYVTQITVTVLFLGVVIKNLGTTSLFLLNACISLVLLGIYRRGIKGSLRDTGGAFRAGLKSLFYSGDYFLFLFLFLLVVQILVTAIKIYFLPPFVGDVFSYHLHPVVDWFQQGQILSYTDTPVGRAMENPLGAKFLHLWFIRFVGDITWIELPQFLFGMILCMTVYVIMRKMDIKQSNALRYAIVIYFMPTVLLQSRTCQDHLIFATCILMALNLVMDVIYLGRQKQIFPLFLVIGLLFAIKKHSVLVLFAILLAVLLSKGFNRKVVLEFIQKNRRALALGIFVALGYSGYFLLSKRQLYQWIWARYSANAASIVLKTGVVVTVLIVLGWVLKRFQVVAFFKRRRFILPLMGILLLVVMGGVVIQKWAVLRPFLVGPTSPVMVQNRHFDHQYPAFNHPFLKNILAFPFRIKDIGLYTAYTPDLLEQSGFGLSFFTFGLLAYLLLLPLCLFKKAYRNSIMGFLLFFSILLLSAYYIVYFSWANYRSFLFFGVIGLMGWAFMLEKLPLKKWALRYIDGLLVVMILFCAVTCFFEGNMSPARWKTLLTLDHAEERTSIKYASLMEISSEERNWAFIDQLIPASEPIAYSCGGASWIFPYYDYQLKRRIYFLKSLPGFATEPLQIKGGVHQMLVFSEDLRVSLKQRGIHYIHLLTEWTHIKDEVYMPEDVQDVYKVARNLYYVKW